MVSADVEKALAAVPSDFRMAVILADLEDFSYKEIAEIMDCPAGTVMSRLFRGRKILQGLLHDYAVEQGIIQPQAAAGRRRGVTARRRSTWPPTGAGETRARAAGVRRELRRTSAPRFRPTSIAS